MKRGTKLIVLAAGLAVIIGAYFAVDAVTAKKEAEEAETVSNAESLAVGTYDDINALSWTYLDESVTLTKDEDGNWICSDDEALPVDQAIADTLVSAAAAVSGELYVDEAEDLSEYGLDEPELCLTVTAGDTERSYAVGDYNSLAGMYYMSIDGGAAVYLEDGSLDGAFWYDMENLVQFESAPTDIATLYSLEVQSDVQSYTLSYTEEPLTRNYTDAFGWFEETESGYRAIESSGAENLCDLLTGISFTSCVTWDADKAALTEYGLDEPQGTAAISYEDTDGENQSFALEFGDYTDGGEIYVRLAGSDMVYLTDGESLDQLMYADLTALLPESFLDTSGAEITAITAVIDGEEYELDPSSEDVCDFLDTMAAVYSTGSAQDKSGREELFSLKLSFDNEAVNELEIRFMSYDSTSSLCLAGDEQAFVSRTSVESLLSSLLDLTSTETETELYAESVEDSE